MTSEDRWMSRLAEARRIRDERVANAQQEFRAVVTQAHRGGTTLSDIRIATGLSTATIREIVRKDARGAD